MHFTPQILHQLSNSGIRMRHQRAAEARPASLLHERLFERILRRQRNPSPCAAKKTGSLQHSTAYSLPLNLRAPSTSTFGFIPLHPCRP